jgi:hypothetical protein
MGARPGPIEAPIDQTSIEYLRRRRRVGHMRSLSG